MTQKAAICKSLLKGEVLSVMTAFKWFGCTNLAREVGRSVEREFMVKVSRVRVEFTSRYGQPGFYYEFRLNRTPMNAEGILLMEKYVSEEEKAVFKPPVKRGPKILHVKPDHPKNAELEFNTTTGSWKKEK